MSRVDRSAVQAMYRAGEKLDYIGSLFGVSKQRVEQIARELGEPKRPRKPRTPRVPKITRFGNVRLAERNRRIIEARVSGMTFPAIAEAEGMTLGSVKKVWRSWGPAR